LSRVDRKSLFAIWTEKKVAMNRLFTVFLLILLISGCAGAPTTDVSLYRKNLQFPPTDTSSVRVFNKPPAQREYIEIGEITVDRAPSLNDANRLLKIKSAEYGADAVYIYESTKQQETVYYPPQCNYAYYYPHSRFYTYRGARYYYPRYHYCYGGETYIDNMFHVVGIAIKFIDNGSTQQ